jgi:hypothetical protein
MIVDAAVGLVQEPLPRLEELRLLDKHTLYR